MQDFLLLSNKLHSVYRFFFETCVFISQHGTKNKLCRDDFSDLSTDAGLLVERRRWDSITRNISWTELDMLDRSQQYGCLRWLAS